MITLITVKTVNYSYLQRTAQEAHSHNVIMDSGKICFNNKESLSCPSLKGKKKITYRSPCPHQIPRIPPSSLPSSPQLHTSGICESHFTSQLSGEYMSPKVCVLRFNMPTSVVAVLLESTFPEKARHQIKSWSAS